MNYGPLIFLAAFFALASSWFGFVMTPQMQVGQLQQTNTVPNGESYPVGRPGLAREGIEVYRANGCASCHSQQPIQTGTVCDVILNDAGTNPPALIAALRTLNPDWSEAQTKECLAKLPKPVRSGITRQEADAALKAVSVGGAKASLWIVPVGPDIAGGWAKRRTVAYDYLFDYPVMLGFQRIGPDLANAALHRPDARWHLRHLYAPRLEVKDSIMAPYRFLFEKRKIERAVSLDALVLPPELAPPSGYEIVPKQEAKALVAYLLSLRADAPLFVAPLTVTPPPAQATNAPAATNATSSLPAK
jgi:cbb3-type cytochrome oxidase cytochrome c subunit